MYVGLVPVVMEVMRALNLFYVIYLIDELSLNIIKCVVEFCNVMECNGMSCNVL